MTDQNLDKIIDLLRSVGAKGCLDKDDSLSLVRKDWINRRAKIFWNPIAELLSKPDLENLFRGLVITERELNWLGGSGASAIWVFQAYQRRFEDASDELTKWAFINRGLNLYIPFGGKCGQYISYDEWIKLGKQRIAEYHSRQQFEQNEKVVRQKLRLDRYKARICDAKIRATRVKSYNERLSDQNFDNRLRIIAHSDMPLDSVKKELLDEVLGDLPSLDTKTTQILLEKIDRRDRGSWGRLKRALLLRSLGHDELSE